MKKIRKQDYLELAVFLSHYHSGQWSRGYRILSRLMSAPWNARWNSGFEREAQESEVYHHLVANYAKTV